MENSDANTQMNKLEAENLNAEDSHTLRNEDPVQLRKVMSEYHFFKRPCIGRVDLTSPLDEADGEPAVLMKLYEIEAAMKSTSPELQLAGIRMARELLSRENKPPIDLFIRHGLVPMCVRFLQNNSNTPMQLEAAWTITNIAAGTSEHTACVIDQGAVPMLVSLLQSKSFNLVKQAAWALGNIAGDSDNARDMVIQHNVIDALLPLVKNEAPQSLLHTVVWLMANLCYQTSSSSFERVRRMLPTLSELLLSQDLVVLAEVCWAFFYLTDIDDNIWEVVDAGAVRPLVVLLESDENSVILPALRSVGNIVAGTDAQTESVIAAGGLSRFIWLLNSGGSDIVEETVWIVSNIAANNQLQIQMVLLSGIFHKIRELIVTGVLKAEVDAAWAVTNVIMGGSTKQVIAFLKEFKILKPYINLLDAKDPCTVRVVMSGLKYLLSFADKLKDKINLCLMVEELGGLEKLEVLQQHENEKIQQEAVAIVDKYFNNGEEEHNTPLVANTPRSRLTI